MEITAAIIGGVFVLIGAVITPLISNRLNAKKKADKQVESNSKYAICQISDIVKNEMRINDLNIDGLRFASEFNISDLKAYTKKVFYPKVNHSLIEQRIDSAREKAFSIKYAKPKEDEKLTDINHIRLDNLKKWENYFYDLLERLELNHFNNYSILDIGIGNGYTVKNLYNNAKNVIGIDISTEALKIAENIIPNVKLINNQAENLINIPSGSIDLALGFRVFQSSLLDIRESFHEVFRVLSSGGYLIISIPIMFLKEDGKVLKGLIPPKHKEPSIEYADKLAIKYAELLDTLNFVKIEIDKNSPFEYYITAKRP